MTNRKLKDYDFREPCWRCGIEVVSLNGRCVCFEIVNGVPRVVHEMCHEVGVLEAESDE